jgi:exonuclease III
LSILTYNCNGLGDPKKLKRLLLKLNVLVNKGCIVFLQETHIVDTKYLEMIWKHSFLSNCVKTNSAGVIILHNKQYDLVHKYADREGRQLIAVIGNDERKFIVVNAYFPNDHKQGVTFAEQMYTKVLEAQAEYPDHITFCAGDMNVCLSSNDSLNRIGSQNEDLLSDVIRNNNKVAELSDAYRSVHAADGYTWKRGIIYSRLDYIFVSNSIISKITSASIDWAFESSDHASVKIDFTFEEKPLRGPGIVKVNTKILDDRVVVLQIGKEIEEMMSQTDESWDPHSRLEFLKVAIRSVFSLKVSEMRKVVNVEISETEEELNQIEDLKITTLSRTDISQEEMNTKIEAIDKAVTSLKSKLVKLRKKFSDTMAFVSRAKWFEYGEKSNKFFLNLNKSRQNQKLINKIRNDEKVFVGQDQVSKGITEFYRELYSSQPTEKNNEDNFYENCPKLSEEQAKFLDNDLNLKELQEALSSCKDSSPGPDGIPYMVYKKYWRFMGPIILSAWKHSLNTGNLPPSHLESVITLLPKEGKDTKDIKNWRPITLSNCDSKIITKAISLKTSKVLESILILLRLHMCQEDRLQII